MRNILTFFLTLGMVSVAVGQFGKDRVAALEAIEAMDGPAGPRNEEQREEEIRQLAASYLSQRNRDIDAVVSEIFRMSASATRSEDPLGAPIGVPLREPISTNVDGGEGGDGEQTAEVAVAEGFSTAVKGLDIRGVNPGRNEFLSGSDNIFEGDVVDVSGAGGVFRLWVVEVGEDGVLVMDDKTKRTEKVPLSLGGQSITSQPWGASGTVDEAPPF